MCLGDWSVQSVDCNDAIGLVGEESGGVVRVDNSTPCENTFKGIRRKNGNGLICPMEKVYRGCMAPVLIAGYESGRIILEAVSFVMFVRADKFR